MSGDALDLLVGVVVVATFGNIVSSLGVADSAMPRLIGVVNFANAAVIG